MDYCGLKCLYLEKYYAEKDFVVLMFEAMFKDAFAACYVKHWKTGRIHYSE
jgi:hypothetical protein